ncbi:MAG: DUF2986 domain-containing protein [Pseudomonadota bacterium]|nr:DUF2986 domain-containing protein [Pseudomonadota bacterium]
MNRQKALKKKFMRKLKQAKAKHFPKNKEKYISKADREAMAKKETIESTES